MLEKESFATDFDEEFDPLKEDEITLDEIDYFDEEDPDAIEEMPMMPNMPEGVVRKGVFSAESYDDPREAISLLFEKNPGRRPVFLQIIEMCLDGKPASEITVAVNEIQAANASVYAPMTLCRALEQAGALTVEIPDSATALEGIDDVGYLEITESVDPIWTATDAGTNVLHTEREGNALKELLRIDETYLSIYQRVLAFCAEAPRTKKEIDAVVDFDPLVQSPRRFSNHFIELLEKTDALIWTGETWNITDLGTHTLTEMERSASLATETQERHLS